MSKYQLVINSDDPNEISSLLAALGSSTAVATVQHMSGAPAAGGAMPGSTGAGTVTHNDDSEDDDKDGAPADPNGADSTGLPWDDRIHSTPAQLTEKGVWRAKRGVGKNKEFVAQVEAELRNRATAPAQQQQPAQTAPVQQMPQQFQQPGPGFDPNTQPVYQQPQQFQPTPAPQFPPFAVGQDGQVQTQPVYQQPQFPQPGQFPQPQQQQPVYQQPQNAQPGPGPAATVQAPTGLDFNAFMQKIQVLLATPSQHGGMLMDAPYLQKVAERIGVASITDIGANQGLIDNAIKLMASEGRWV